MLEPFLSPAAPSSHPAPPLALEVLALDWAHLSEEDDSEWAVAKRWASLSNLRVGLCVVDGRVCS
jgi:hypothetical protein